MVSFIFCQHFVNFPHQFHYLGGIACFLGIKNTKPAATLFQEPLEGFTWCLNMILKWFISCIFALCEQHHSVTPNRPTEELKMLFYSSPPLFCKHRGCFHHKEKDVRPWVTYGDAVSDFPPDQLWCVLCWEVTPPTWRIHHRHTSPLYLCFSFQACGPFIEDKLLLV